jgi:hypothetical protein
MIFNFLKRKKKLQESQIDIDTIRFLQMLIKMSTRRPNFNVRRVMILVYPELCISIDELISSISLKEK